MTTHKQELPVGWRNGGPHPEYYAGIAERTTALKILPKRVHVFLAAAWTRSVLPFLEKHGPENERGLQYIKTVENYAANPTKESYDAVRNLNTATLPRTRIIRSQSPAASATKTAYLLTRVVAAAVANGHRDDTSAFSAAGVAFVVIQAVSAEAGGGRELNFMRAATKARIAEEQKWRWLYTTYRHAVGPEGLVFDPEWRTSTVVQMAQGIVAEQAFDRMPILADALQDAGCVCPELLRHLQTDQGEWTAADWSLWNALGYGD